MKKVKEGKETETKLEKWIGRVRHGLHLSQIEVVRGNESWMRMIGRHLQRETESMLAAGTGYMTNYRRERS